MIEDIKYMLTKSQYDQKTQNQLVSTIEEVNDILEMNKKLQLQSFYQEMEENQKKILENLKELQLKISKNSGLFSFLKLDKSTIDFQSTIKFQLLDLQKQVQSYFKSINCDTDSINLMEQQVLELNHIRTKLQFILNHPKFEQIGIIIEFLIFESDQINEYQLIIQHNYLIQKFQQYFEQYQIPIHKKLDNQVEKALFTLKYDRTEKELLFLIENDPYIITSNLNQSKIYLDKDMLLIFDDFYKLKVNQTNTKNINRQQLSSSNQNKQDKREETLKINMYGYIEFQFVNLDKKIEFYLKDSNLDLSNHLLGIQAILYHDSNGFYIIPKYNSNPYKLIYPQKLITKDPQVIFGIQLQNKFWIEVELDKQNSNFLVFD